MSHLQCQAWPFTSVIPHLCIGLQILAAFSILHVIGIGVIFRILACTRVDALCAGLGHNCVGIASR